MANPEMYTLGPESMASDDAPKGSVTRHIFSSSEVYPDTDTEYWVYVPDSYSERMTACVMLFQDGEEYLKPNGAVRATAVLDNLIHKGEMPVTIGIFINPSKKSKSFDMREQQYVPINDTYASFLLNEIIPLVQKDYNLVTDPNGRAIVGMSDGGLASFTAAWHRPDAFSKVISHIGSYTRLKGGSEYPYLIRKTRGKTKPIRVFIQGGRNDLNILEGNWTLANIAMDSALMFARYDYKFEMGNGGHSLRHGGAIFPKTLRWIWRDYPGVRQDSYQSSSIVGDWEITTNIYGLEVTSDLKITENEGLYSGKIWDEVDGELRVDKVSWDGDVLIIEHEAPISHFQWMTKESKRAPEILSAWLKVRGDTLSGALASELDSMYDFRVIGKRLGSANDEKIIEPQHPTR